MRSRQRLEGESPAANRRRRRKTEESIIEDIMPFLIPVSMRCRRSDAWLSAIGARLFPSSFFLLPSLPIPRRQLRAPHHHQRPQPVLRLPCLRLWTLDLRLWTFLRLFASAPFPALLGCARRSAPPGPNSPPYLPPRIGCPGLQIGRVSISRLRFSLSLFRGSSLNPIIRHIVGSSFCIARHCR